MLQVHSIKQLVIKYKFLFKVLGYYVLAMFIVYFISDDLIYLPPKSSYQDSENIVKLTTEDGSKISALYMFNPQADFTILLSHGNAEDLGRIRPFMQDLLDSGFSVFSYDYHGYGTSQGIPSEPASYQDILAAYQYLLTQNKIDPKKIILYGRSLGAGPSIELAMNQPVGGLILEGAFTSAYRILTHYSIFFPDKYSNLEKINKIKVPILFIHGKKDTVIPIWHSELLYKEYNGPKKYYWVEEAEHNNLKNIAGPNFNKTLQDYVKELGI